MQNQMNQLYQEITQAIIDDLEKGVAQWVKPWSSLMGKTGLPVKVADKTPYRGINILILSLAAMRRNYLSNVWGGFQQIKAQGGSVKKGEVGTRILFFSFIEKDVEENGVPVRDQAGNILKNRIPCPQTHVVFNMAQTTLADQFAQVNSDQTPTEEQALPAVEAWLNAYLIHAKIAKMPSDRAAYSQNQDCLWMPPPECFRTISDYYATFFHEIAHSTGHSSRLKRDFSGRFGSEAYAFEELVAELSSAFLCAEQKIDGKLQHAEYIGHWIKILRGDNRAIFKAASQAQEAVSFAKNMAERHLRPSVAFESEG